MYCVHRESLEQKKELKDSAPGGSDVASIPITTTYTSNCRFFVFVQASQRANRFPTNCSYRNCSNFIIIKGYSEWLSSSGWDYRPSPFPAVTAVRMLRIVWRIQTPCPLDDPGTAIFPPSDTSLGDNFPWRGRRGPGRDLAINCAPNNTVV